MVPESVVPSSWGTRLPVESDFFPLILLCRFPSEFHRIHDRVEIQSIAELEEIIAQRGQVHRVRNSNRDLRGEHVGTGLHRTIASRIELLDTDVVTGEELGKLTENAWAIGGNHFDDIRQVVVLLQLRAGPMVGQAQFAITIQFCQRVLEFRNRVPRALGEHLDAEFGAERRDTRLGHVAATIGDALAEREKRRVLRAGERAHQQVVVVCAWTRRTIAGDLLGCLLHDFLGAVAAVGVTVTAGYCPPIRLASKMARGPCGPCRVDGLRCPFPLTSPAFLHVHIPLSLKLTGSICALATPFRASDDALDLDAFAGLIGFQIRSGTRGLVVAGSTGEGAALDATEFAILVELARREIADRVPLLAGSGMQSTRKTIEQTRLAASAGAELALVVTPPYVRPTQEGLYRHFSEVAEKGGLPVMLYNVPSRTSCDLMPETVARLCRHSGIIGIKEARTDDQRMRDLLALANESFVVFSGDDPTCARAILAGAAGVVSVTANIAPAAMQALCLSAAQGDVEGSQRLDQRLRDVYDMLAVESNPIPIKWCLQRLGFGADHLRMPLLSLSAAYHARAERVLNESGLLESPHLIRTAD